MKRRAMQNHRRSAFTSSRESVPHETAGAAPAVCHLFKYGIQLLYVLLPLIRCEAQEAPNLLLVVCAQRRHGCNGDSTAVDRVDGLLDSLQYCRLGDCSAQRLHSYSFSVNKSNKPVLLYRRPG